MERSTPVRSHGGVRRVATRLTIQTVALVMVMFFVLEVVVYVVFQQQLIRSLEGNLRQRAGQGDRSVCTAFHLQCGPDGEGGNGGFGGGPPPPAANGGAGQPGGPTTFVPTGGPSDVSAVYVDRHLRIVHADGALGPELLSPSDASLAMTTGAARCCAARTYDGQQYLTYSSPIRSGSHIVGAVQTSISEHQYRQNLDSLLQVLLVAALLGLVGSTGVSAVLVGRALRPIRTAMQRQLDFVADAAHELRTPLAIQRTVGEVGMSDPTIDELQGTVEQMLEENRHLTRLVEDLSLLARSDTDAVSIDRAPLNLSELLVHTADEIEFLANEKGIELDVEAQQNASTVGDVLRLRQLFLILLDNALKHTPSGGTVRVRLMTDGGRVRLTVSDSGPGIDPVDLPRLFDRFYRADQARAGEGTGLGLAIARWIVEAHGGHIEAGNLSHGAGAVFTVTLPLVRVSAPAYETP